MPVVALADFGSTFTKVALVEPDSGRLLGAAQHPTTVGMDVMIGFARARDMALGQAGLGHVDRTLAASSAAGGLRMVAIGLIDDLTAAAAQRCALGAGAKVTAVFSGRMGGPEATRMRDAEPDLILFAGGTDGGEASRVIANARLTASAHMSAAVVVACNRDVSETVGQVFRDAGHETVVVANVLPTIHHQQPGPAREAIRELFIRRVVHAKGLSRAESFFAAVLMPTPAAVLSCAELVAHGTSDHPGTGSAVILDVGGATTDVHSVIAPVNDALRTHRAGPPPSAAVRTVEGDLGVRWSAEAVLALDEAWLVEYSGAAASELRSAILARSRNPSFIAEDGRERGIDRALAASCISLALGRHVGRIATRYTPGEGAEMIVTGRDLREADVLLSTGGSIAHDHEAAAETVTAALRRMATDQPAPQRAQIVIDDDYLAAAVGLLASLDPNAATRLLRGRYPALDRRAPAGSDKLPNLGASSGSGR